MATPNRRDMKRIVDRCLSAMNDVLVSEGMMADAPTYRWFEDQYIRPNVRIMKITKDAHGLSIPNTPERIYFEQGAGHGKFERLRRAWLDQHFTQKRDGTEHRIIGLSRSNRKYPVLTMQIDEHGADSGIIYKWTVNQIVGYMSHE